MGAYRTVVAVCMADKGGAPVWIADRKYRGGFDSDPDAEARMFNLAPRNPYSVNDRLYRLLLKDHRLYHACFKEAG